MNSGSIRLWISILVLWVYLMFSFRIAAIILFVVTLFVVIIMYSGRSNSKYEQEAERRAALQRVSIYLSPHKSIWRNLKVSNKFCTLNLDSSGIIRVTEKGNFNRSFRVVESDIYSTDEVFNMLCVNFDHLTTYDTLLRGCSAFQTRCIEKVISIETNSKADLKSTEESKPIKVILNKTDINNASEVELTALPGISIVISKKIIKKREEINGFKSIDEFFNFIKIKPHMETQLREMVCVKKMQGSIKIKRNTERSVDI